MSHRTKRGVLPRQGCLEHLTRSIDTLGEIKATGDNLIKLNEIMMELQAARDLLDPWTDELTGRGSAI
jgi:hypothetical protein